MRWKLSLAPDTTYTGSGTVVWMRIRDFFKRFSASGAAPGDGVQHQTSAMCGLLFVAAFRVGHPLWSIPAMTLFSLTVITLLCALYAKAWHAVSRKLRKKRPEAGSVLAFP